MSSNEWQVFGEVTYTVHASSRQPWASKVFPATVISEPRDSWLTNDRAWVRRTLEQLSCEEWVNINGHTIQRTEAYRKRTYFCDNEVTDKGTPKRFSLGDTLAKVTAVSVIEEKLYE